MSVVGLDVHRDSVNAVAMSRIKYA